MTALYRVTLLLAFLICFQSSQAQSTSDSINRQILLFPEFTTGRVLLKNGNMESAQLNYNLDKQNIVFVQNGQYLLLDALETVDTIYLQDKKFFPVGGKVCELLLSEGNYHLLATYSSRLVPLTATTDHGGTEQKTNSQVNNTVTNVYVGRNYKSRNQVQVQPRYWMAYKGKVSEIDGKKQLLKAVRPELRTPVQTYLDSKAVDFASAADMTALLHVVAGADGKQ